jgi:hypothetical protein
MAMELKRAVDYYINSSNTIPNCRKKIVREKMLASEWIPCDEQEPPSRKRILARYKDGSVCIGWIYGFQGNGVMNVTHWKPLIK